MKRPGCSGPGARRTLSCAPEAQRDPPKSCAIKVLRHLRDYARDIGAEVLRFEDDEEAREDDCGRGW